MKQIRIESNEDDTVTLHVGSITAHITGDDWRDANDAAQTLGAIIAGRYEVGQLRLRLSGLRSVVQDIERSLEATEFHVRQLAEYATPETSNE